MRETDKCSDNIYIYIYIMALLILHELYLRVLLPFIIFILPEQNISMPAIWA